MKKAAILVLVVFALVCVLFSFLLAEKDDYQVIKKAVKENPDYKPGKEAKWFKLLVTDNETKKDKVRITLPISVIELFIEHTHHKHIKHCREFDVDLKEIFLELKKLGPQVIIEVFEDGETLKIWLE